MEYVFAFGCECCVSNRNYKQCVQFFTMELSTSKYDIK